MSDLHLGVREGLATLTFDRPDSKVNLLTSSVMLRLEQLLQSMEELAAGNEVRAVLIRSAKPDNFIAGADLEELTSFDDAVFTREISRRGQEIFLRLERLPVPTLVAINGSCAGGGMELSLACDYRIARNAASTRMGLPETRLGTLPGLGGTVRLPRLIGLRPALDLILSGKLISAKRALSLGLVDRLLDAEDFDDQAEAIALDLAQGEEPLPRRRRSTLARLTDAAPARWLVHRLTRRAVLARTKGHYPALPRALDVTVSGLGLPVQEAFQRESDAFGELAITPECKNLIFVFETASGARKRAPAGVASPVQHAAVVGAGVMGAGIAELFAYQDTPVQLVDIDDARVQAGIERARGLLDKAAKRAGWSEAELRSRADRLLGVTGYEAFADVDLVIEAVVERMDVKRQVFSDIEASVGPDAIIATNTSALSITQLQQNLMRPERTCGLHFFNPPHRMPLVEVVRGDRTGDDALATAFRTAAGLGKTPIVVKDTPGFVVNRILAAYLTEAGHLLQSGLGIEDLDRTMSRFGMPMGPLLLLDEIGLDVVAEVGETMVSAFGERFAAAPVMGKVLATGVTGRKGGRGFYRYKGSRSKGVNPEIKRLVRQAATRQPPAVQQAQERMVLLMVNEAARILEDGVADSPATVDVAMIMGAGFPPFRGGLLRYADSLGLDHVVHRLRHYAERVDRRFEPTPSLLERRAFYTYD